MNPVQGFSIPAVPSPPAVPRADAAAGAPQTTFKDLLLDGIQQVNSMQQQADVAVQQLMTGEEVDPAVVLTTIQKADMSFRMMTQIRNKLVAAYQEVKEMRI
ncbi:MAG: flagellar hook-basal body complex protein FliE [Planctomycetaceae bacterium]|nr:flagellar hook-basal body complex protein FliE [Planctomycetaceae bacterium]